MKNIIKTDGKNRVLSLVLNVLVFQEDEYFVSYCPSLNLSSYGDSIQDAKDGFDEVVTSYLEECKKNGTLRNDLIQHGWTIESSSNHGTAFPPEQVELNIPAGLLKSQFNESRKVFA